MKEYMRHYHRYTWKGRVRVTDVEGLELFADARNISQEGMNLVFDQAGAKCIIPAGFAPNPSDPIELALLVEVPGGEQLMLSAQVRGVRRLAQDAFSFHLEFVQVSAKMSQSLGAFLKPLPRES